MACVHRQLETKIQDQVDLFSKQGSQIDSRNWEWDKVQERAQKKVTRDGDFNSTQETYTAPPRRNITTIATEKALILL